MYVQQFWTICQTKRSGNTESQWATETRLTLCNYKLKVVVLFVGLITLWTQRTKVKHLCGGVNTRGCTERTRNIKIWEHCVQLKCPSWALLGNKAYLMWPPPPQGGWWTDPRWERWFWFGWKPCGCPHLWTRSWPSSPPLSQTEESPVGTTSRVRDWNSTVTAVTIGFQFKQKNLNKTHP